MSTHRWVYSFEEVVTTDGEEAKQLLGGKGASLAAMSQAGLRVPPGFTITTEACRYFYENDGAWPEDLARQVDEHLMKLEAKMGSSFGAGASPFFVSVRSGASSSMPGMMDTILNCGIHPQLVEEMGGGGGFWRVCVQFMEAMVKTVTGVPAGEHLGEAGLAEVERLAGEFAVRSGRAFPETARGMLVEGINAVFRSWNSERAVAYRKHHGISGMAGTAVNIQVMFPSQISGIVFTQDPNDLRAERLVVESAYGLGEAVVSGDVTPDRFLVQRKDFTLIEAFRGSKLGAVAALGDESVHDASALTLSPLQIGELCGLCLGVENYFGHPADIEWGWADGEFALLQSRAIRGLDLVEDAERAREETVVRLGELAKGGRRVWVTHNLGETLRAPTPLTWGVVKKFMSGAGGFGQMYADFGYLSAPEVVAEGFLELVCGRIYADPVRLAGLFWDGLPMSYDLGEIVRDKSALDRAPTIFDPSGVDEKFLWKLPGSMRAMFRASRALKKQRRVIRAQFEEKILPGYLEYVEGKRTVNLESWTTAEVLGEFEERSERVLQQFGKESLKPAFFGGIALGELEGLLGQILGEEEGMKLARLLTTSLDNDSTFEQDAMLYGVAKGEFSMEEFLGKYGHRATGEMELSEPRWREDWTYLEKVVGQIRRGGGRSLEVMHEENRRKYEEALSGLDGRLREFGGSAFTGEILEYLGEARGLLPYRERSKHYLMMGYELIRQTVVELGRRWGLGAEIFFLEVGELPRFEEESVRLRGEIARRKLRWKAFQRLELPDVIDSNDLQQIGKPPIFEAAEEWQGDAVSAGVATGVVQIVFNPREVDDLGDDYVLVCPSTDPGWTPLFMNARALIVERGGVLSHGAIVARDFGIPAIVCPKATGFLRSGERVRVDGNTGKLTRLGES